MTFFVGLHQPSDARHFTDCCVSVGRLRSRKGPFAVKNWIMDSQAFTTIQTHGGYPNPPEEYAAQIKRWRSNGTLLAAASQDFMCEPAMLKRTGLSISDHQRLTIERYDALLRCETGCYVMPVLQGFSPHDYARCLTSYGDRLARGAWVGVGSVCKRNSDPAEIVEVLAAIKRQRPDLRLHGFGLKITALSNGTIRRLLHSADSMAWSFAARKRGTGANDWRNAARFVAKVSEDFEYQAHFIEQEIALTDRSDGEKR